MHRTPQLDRRGHSLLARLLICDVCLNHLGHAALLVDHPLGVLSPVDIEVHKSNFGAVTGEEDCCRTPIANLTWWARMSKEHEQTAGDISSERNVPSIRDPAPVTMATSPLKSKALGGGAMVMICC